MKPENQTASSTLLASGDAQLVEAVQATALALGVELTVATDAKGIGSAWRRSSLRLVGVDMMPVVSRQPRLAETFLVGARAEDLAAASARLGAPVIVLPGGSDDLGRLLSRQLSAHPLGQILWVSGASGGLGTSSLVAGLAARATALGTRSAAVELARLGGGLDLLFGAERRGGLRWKDLAEVEGRLGVLDDQLLVTEGTSVLPLDREDTRRPDEAGVATVLESLMRSHRAVFVDAGRGGAERPPPAAREVLLVGADVVSVSAARMFLATQGDIHVELVVRTGPGRTLPPGAVAEALGLELLGVVRQDRAVVRRAEAGMAIGAGMGGKFRRDTDRIWQELVA